MHVSRNPPLAAALAGGRILVAGGDATGTTAEVYDPAADSWTPTANEMQADRAGAAPTPRGAVAVALPGGNVLLAGGIDLISVLTAEADR